MQNQLNIKRYGSGSNKLVAIHGLGSASSAWDLVRPQLQEATEFITLDLPGHGDAEMRATLDMNPKFLAELIKQELAKHRIDNFHLIGNSLGGWICLEMAAKFPETVRSVTAVAPAGLWLVPSKKRIPQLAVSRYIARATYLAAKPISKIKWMRKVGFQYVSPQWEKFTPETCAKAAIAMGSASGYYTLWDAFLGNRFDSPINEKIPVTIIFGDSDYTLPVENCQERSLVPNHAKWLVLPKSGHAPMWDQVDAVVQSTLESASN